MKKKVLLFLSFVSCFVLFGCITTTGYNESISDAPSTSNSSQNNNSIIINSVEYYFQVSSQLSSPQPIIEESGFISEGSWYGEDAAKAWASILEWTIGNCHKADMPITVNPGDKVYINQVHAYRKNTENGMRFIFGDLSPLSIYYKSNAAVKIYYWVVPKDVSLEHGRSEYRRFWFN